MSIIFVWKDLLIKFGRAEGLMLQPQESRILLARDLIPFPFHSSPWAYYVYLYIAVKFLLCMKRVVSAEQAI